MPADFSFDIVSKIDLQEVDNAVNQVLKEIATRYDFKGSRAVVRFDRATGIIALEAEDTMKLRSVRQMLLEKAAKRGISPKALEYTDEHEAGGGLFTQEAKLIQGLNSDRARAIVKTIKGSRLKVQPAIQDDQVRVSGRVKDDLQEIMRVVKATHTDVPLQFVNYR